jgi:nucleotide-binding universal stress UspA family protein
LARCLRELIIENMKLLHLKVVLAAIDADESSLDTLRAARELAHAAGATLHVVHATAAAARGEQAPGGGDADDVRALFARADVQGSGASLDIVAGEPTHVIRSFADKIRANIIVLGQHRGRRTDQPRLGSTALGVVTNSWAPCLVLSGPMRLPLEQVLVPVDLSNTSRGALHVALSWASALRQTRKGGAEGSDTAALTALFIDTAKRKASPRALDDELERLRRDAGTWAGVSVRGVVVAKSDVPQAIAEYVGEHQSDLIVLGTRGLGSDEVGRLGSVALGVVRRMEQPILLVPPAVWESYASTS